MAPGDDDVVVVARIKKRTTVPRGSDGDESNKHERQNNVKIYLSQDLPKWTDSYSSRYKHVILAVLTKKTNYIVNYIQYLRHYKHPEHLLVYVFVEHDFDAKLLSALPFACNICFAQYDRELSPHVRMCFWIETVLLHIKSLRPGDGDDTTKSRYPQHIYILSDAPIISEFMSIIKDEVPDVYSMMEEVRGGGCAIEMMFERVLGLTYRTDRG